MVSLNISSTTNRGYLYNYFQDVFAKKRKLVPLEIQEIVRSSAQWQDILQTTGTNRPLAESSIKNCYRAAGLSSPNIIWAEHPLNVIKILFNRPDLCDVSDVLIRDFWHSELAIQKSIAAESAMQVLTAIDPKYRVKNVTGDRDVEIAPDYLNELVMGRVGRLYCELAERNIPTPFQDYNINILGYFDYFARAGVEMPRMLPKIALAKSCGWCWTFEKLAILTPKHSSLKIDRFGEIVGIIYNDVNILSSSR
jgi:hypothetical protein